LAIPAAPLVVCAPLLPLAVAAILVAGELPSPANVATLVPAKTTKVATIVVSLRIVASLHNANDNAYCRYRFMFGASSSI
jgi:hypothetical protein